MSTDDTEGKTTQITRKGRVTISKDLREEFGLEEGDEIRWQGDEDGIKVRKATQSAGRGMLVDEDISDEKRDGDMNCRWLHMPTSLTSKIDRRLSTRVLKRLASTARS